MEKPKFPLSQSEDQGSAVSKRDLLLKTRDAYKSKASELQRGVAEPQATKYETALYALMQRTEDNPDLINALNAFIDALDGQAQFGNPDQLLGKQVTEKLVEFFRSTAESLHFDVGTGRFTPEVRKRWREDKGFN